MSGVVPHPDDLCRRAEQWWAADRPQDAVEAAWAAFDLDPSRRPTRRLLARLLGHYPAELHPNRLTAYLALLTDRGIEPDRISTAGWQLLLRRPSAGEDAGDETDGLLLASLEGDELALTLLRESPVYLAAAERLLSRLRRRLLLSGHSRRYPKLVAALKHQASLNGGAWYFDDAERAGLAKAENGAMAAAYIPARPSGAVAPETNAAADPVTRAVAAQYEAWPYPAWTRITMRDPTTLPDTIRGMDERVAAALPTAANILIAGCGTGRQAAYVATAFPDAAITAIDISEASLDYARRQCGALGIDNVRFASCDLHDAATLGARFHAIYCAGVLHHLPDPERGLKILAGVLHAGGVMQIMVYNRAQRLMIAAARTLLIDLLKEPVTDDLLRRVRARLLQQPAPSVASQVIKSPDFATLAGAHDLLLHRHEDAFDIARIERALDQAGLQLLSFSFRSPPMAARYDARFPEDPKHRDSKAMALFAKSDPEARVAHFRFWCRKSRY